MSRVDWWLLVCVLFAIGAILWVGLFREWRLEGELRGLAPTIRAGRVNEE